MKKLILLSIVSLLLQAGALEAARANPFNIAIKVLTGAGAAKALELGSEADFRSSNAVESLVRLRSQGVDLYDGAIFSLYFKLNSDASSVYWSDIFSKPDIYFVVSIEGQGDFLIPRYANEYAGQPILEKIISKQIDPGQKIIIKVFDDDSTSDLIWNNILKAKITQDVTAGISASFPLAAVIGASGRIEVKTKTSVDFQFLAKEEHVTLDAPELVAVAEFLAPKTSEELWVADGLIVDQKNRQVGKFQFSQVWRAEPVIVEEIQSEIEKEEGSKVFWYGIAVVFILIFGKLMITKEDNQESNKSG
jgi:hypothetical protein